ncbi:hypothetical protein BDA96_10G178000 [Sorghum bicolor]|uniref:Uncharacterized protein n=1 Tax=Sorghum bicolor TaxID=4558 RepID=A0A921Q4K9_SORBI|nr:hypothetical protein BDA96_10G178000 [Sorghum bicolor]
MEKLLTGSVLCILALSFLCWIGGIPLQHCCTRKQSMLPELHVSISFSFKYMHVQWTFVSATCGLSELNCSETCIYMECSQWEVVWSSGCSFMARNCNHMVFLYAKR